MNIIVYQHKNTKSIGSNVTVSPTSDKFDEHRNVTHARVEANFLQDFWSYVMKSK